MALNEYPICTKGTLFPDLSERLPKYPLLNPAVASATPSSNPMRKIEKPNGSRNMFHVFNYSTKSV